MKFYRYVWVNYGEAYSDIVLQLCEYNLYKETPMGYWIGYLGKLHCDGRWVSKTARKRFAYPTKEEAMVNFIKRTERRIKILNSQINCCKTALSLTKKQAITIQD